MLTSEINAVNQVRNTYLGHNLTQIISCVEVIFKLNMSFSYIQHRTQILLVIAGEEKYGPLVASGTATMVRSPNLIVNWLVTRIQNVLLMIEFQM